LLSTNSRARLQLAIRARSAELVEAVLEAHGAEAITFTGGSGESLIEPKPGAAPGWADTELTALFPADADVARIVGAVADALGAQPRWHAELLEDRDWVRAWMAEWQPLPCGHGLWICPRHRHVPEPDAVVVRLDPGVAFGTGAHATTALCLEWLAAHPPRGCRVIDYGCGSGVLAIAAACLGARGVHAVDIDPQAVRATRANAAANAVSDRVFVGNPGTLANTPADVVIANILAGPLIELASTLGPLTARGGTLILAGVLERQAPQVVQAYRPWLRLAVHARRAGWVRLAGRRDSA